MSPDQQREAIERYAQAHGIKLEAIYTDLDKSGSKMKRPEFDRMMEAIAEGRTGGVIVAKLDRFGRTLVGALKVLESMEESGATFVSVADSFDTSTANGRMILRIMLTLAEWELERIKDNWADATARAIARGVHTAGSIPFGYQKQRGRPMTLDPQAAPIVREVFRRRATRESLASLARWLDEVQPREKGHWQTKTLSQMIANRAYLGEAFHGEEIRNPDAHEAIVTLPEFNAANAVQGGPGAIRDGSALLSGVIRCAGCRYALSRQKTSGGAWAYRCERHHSTGTCAEPVSVTASLIEDAITDQFLTWHGAEISVEVPDADPLAEAERALADAEARLTEFEDDLEAMEALGRESWLRAAQRRREAVEVATAALEQAQTTAYLGRARISILEDDFRALDTAGQGRMIREAVDTVYVRKGSEPIESRVWIRWADEDDTDRPARGRKDYRVRPVDWPEYLEAANVPTWAIRNGHHALRETNSLVETKDGRRGLFVAEGVVRMAS